VDVEQSYVAWHEISDVIGFESVLADSDNVRELVRRLRRKLATLHSDDLIQSRRTWGYRMAGDVR